MKGKKLIIAIAAAAIAAPAATAGADTGIGIPAGRDAASPVAPLVSENTAGLFGSPQSTKSPAGKFGPLDPWAYRVIHQSLDPNIANAMRNHSPGRNGFSKAAASVPAAASGGFEWGDAGIGAGVAFAAILLVLGLARLTLRRSRARLAGI